MNNNDTFTIADAFEKLIATADLNKDYADAQLRGLLADFERFIKQATEALDQNLTMPSGFDPVRMASRYEQLVRDREQSVYDATKFTKLLNTHMS